MHESYNVLVFEDDADSVEQLIGLLVAGETTKFAVETVNTLSRGLNRLGAGGVDVVILDLYLPDSKGRESVEALQKSFPAIPVVVLTGKGEPDSEREAIEAGAQEYLSKDSLEQGSLIQAIIQAIYRHRVRQTFSPMQAAVQAVVDKSDALNKLSEGKG